MVCLELTRRLQNLERREKEAIEVTRAVSEKRALLEWSDQEVGVVTIKLMYTIWFFKFYIL